MPSMAKNAYNPSKLDVCGETIATALGILGNCPSKRHPCARYKFLKKHGFLVFHDVELDRVIVENLLPLLFT